MGLSPHPQQPSDPPQGQSEPGGHRPEGVVVVVDGQADLLEVVDALGASGGLAGRLDGGQQAGRSGRR